MTNKPEQKFSFGGVHAAIWNNPTAEGKDFKTVSLQRRYTDSNGEWQTSQTFRRDDIPKAKLALEKAYEALFEKQSSEQGETQSELVAQ